MCFWTLDYKLIHIEIIDLAEIIEKYILWTILEASIPIKSGRELLYGIKQFNESMQMQKRSIHCRFNIAITIPLDLGSLD